MNALPFADPFVEETFQRERAALGQPAPRSSPAWFLIGSLILFLFAGAVVQGAPLPILAAVVAVLALHEGGHFVAMKLFSYRDVRMFFIPFLGAAVEGRRSSVAAWKQGVVLLMGPAPGLMLALVLVELMRIEPLAPSLYRLLWISVLVLVAVNALNLLPLGSLDGARLLQRVLFCRWPQLEVVFLAAAGGTMLALSIWLHLWVLAAVAAFGLATIPRRHRVLALAHALRERGELSELDLALEPDARLRPLFRAAYDALPGEQCLRERAIARLMEELVDAARPAPSWTVTLLLLSAWLASIGMAIAVSALWLRG
jgi:hypothetical protein